MKPKLIKSAKRTAPLRAMQALKDRVYDKIIGVCPEEYGIVPRPWMPPWDTLGTRNVPEVYASAILDTPLVKP